MSRKWTVKRWTRHSRGQSCELRLAREHAREMLRGRFMGRLWGLSPGARQFKSDASPFWTGFLDIREAATPWAAQNTSVTREAMARHSDAVHLFLEVVEAFVAPIVPSKALDLKTTQTATRCTESAA